MAEKLNKATFFSNLLKSITKIKAPEEMLAAQEAYIAELFEQRKNDIEYYLNNMER